MPPLSPPPAWRPAIFLDRDGVIIENRADYCRSWEEVVILPGALQALARAQGTSYAVVIITNQSAVGRGLLKPGALDDIHQRMLAACAESGIVIEAVFVCPHAPGDGCACRKPRPGLLLQAMAALGEPPERCLAIGDGYEDLQAANEAGVPFVLVRTGRGRETARRLNGRASSTLIVDDLWAVYQALRDEALAVEAS